MAKGKSDMKCNSCTECILWPDFEQKNKSNMLTYIKLHRKDIQRVVQHAINCDYFRVRQKWAEGK